MKLEILTPETKLFSGEVKSVKLPGTAGTFEVLDHHAPLISTLDAGSIRVRPENGEDQYFEVNAGFVEVLDNVVTVMV
jgi:F-type H+-transporting ATPase subunit epsilon